MVLPRYLVFYATLFAAFGTASPFLPGLLQEYGLTPGQLGLVLAAGTAVRLVAGPLGGALADRTGRPRLLLAGLAALAAAVALAYQPARGVALLLTVSVVHAAVLAPLVPIADAMSLAASRAHGFAYGWVRGAGSAAFIGGVMLSGAWVADAGLGVIIWLNAALLAAAAAAATLLPGRAPSWPAPSWPAPSRPVLACRRARPAPAAAPFLSLIRNPPFACLLAVAALIGGSHAMHDGFEVIRWRQAGLSARDCSLLWSLSVASEVVVFVFIGPPLLRRLGPAGAMALSAAAGIVRWGTAAQTAGFAAMAVVEPLHGLTFALLHLAAMDMIARVVPARSAATAQACYGTLAMGAAAAAATLASGPLYARFGPDAFWFMAALCVLAFPAIAALRNTGPWRVPAPEGPG